MTSVRRAKSDSKTGESAKLDVRAFGGLSIYCKGAPITIIWESQKARLLFCYLLVTYDQWVHRDKLIEVLWPGCDIKAGANNFKTTVSRLRKSFSGPQTINPVITQGEAVRIDVNAISLDASLFRYNATNGIKFQARGDHNSARESLETAQDLYTGEFLPEEPFNPFISATRSELHLLYASVLSSLEKVYQHEQNSDAMEALLALKRSMMPHQL